MKYRGEVWFSTAKKYVTTADYIDEKNAISFMISINNFSKGLSKSNIKTTKLVWKDDEFDDDRFKSERMQFLETSV